MDDDAKTTGAPTPAHRKQEAWALPRVIRLDGDGKDPRNTKLFDAETGEPLGLPIAGLSFTSTADEAPALVLVLQGVSLKAEVHDYHIEMDEEDLAALAEMNGFSIVPTPRYVARVVRDTPTTYAVWVQQFKYTLPIGEKLNRAALKKAEHHLASLLRLDDVVPSPAPAPEGQPNTEENEFWLYAR